MNQQIIVTPAIAIENATKIYRLGVRRRSITAVQNLTLSVARGETFAFIGLNGAGKTTTIKMLLDHARPSAGRVELFGVSARLARSRVKVGYMPDLPHFYRFLNASELLNYFGMLFELPRREIDGRRKRLLEMVGLDGRDTEPLRSFSRGMLQRIGLAQALINDPDLLILDEPLGGLDPVGRKDFRDIILDLRRQGKTIFFSSHILEDAEKIADRVGIIHLGRLIAEGPLNELLTKTEGWEAEIEPLNDYELTTEDAAGWSVRNVDGLIYAEFADDAAVNRLQQLAVSNKIRIRSLTPRRMSLEEAFLAELERWQV